MRRRIRAALTAFAFAVATLAVTATPAYAAEPDSQRMCDNIPNDDLGGTYTQICVRVNTDDIGYARYGDTVNVSYNNSKVHHLYDVYLLFDSYSDGTWNVQLHWNTIVEGTYYGTSTASCVDPCRVKFTGVASEPNDSDSVFSMTGPAEADD